MICKHVVMDIKLINCILIFNVMNVNYCVLLLLVTSVVSTVIDPRLAGLSSNGVEGQSDDVLWIRDSPKQFIVFPQI